MGDLSIIMGIPKRMETYKIFQNEQIDENERTRNRLEWAPVLDRQAEGQVEKRRSRKEPKGREYQQMKASITCVQLCKGQAEHQEQDAL